MPKSTQNLLSSFLLLFLITVGNAANLVDIRTGNHGHYSRVVIQFSKPVKYQVITDLGNSTLVVDVATKGYRSTLGRIWVDDNDPVLNSVRYNYEPRQVTVQVNLKVKNFDVVRSELEWPFRIVLDITRAKLVPAALTKAEPGKRQEPAVEPTIETGVDRAETLSEEPLRSNVPDEVAQHTRLLSEPPKAQTPAGLELPVEADEYDRSASMFKVNPLWLITILFLLVDMLVLVIYMSRRAKKNDLEKAKRLKRHTQAQPNGALAVPPPEQVMPAIVEPSVPVNPEPSPQEFVGLLKQAMQGDDFKARMLGVSPAVPEVEEEEELYVEIEIEPEEIPALVEPVKPPPEPPDLKQIVRELYPDIPIEELTEEGAREQLIGRDGVEFMRNIKRLYLN